MAEEVSDNEVCDGGGGDDGDDDGGARGGGGRDDDGGGWPYRTRSGARRWVLGAGCWEFAAGRLKKKKVGFFPTMAAWAWRAGVPSVGLTRSLSLRCCAAAAALSTHGRRSCGCGSGCRCRCRCRCRCDCSLTDNLPPVLVSLAGLAGLLLLSVGRGTYVLRTSYGRSSFLFPPAGASFPH